MSLSDDKVKYPELFSWNDLLSIISWCELHKLKRHPEFQAKYDEWRNHIINKFGSATNFLLSERLGWINTNGFDGFDTPPISQCPTPNLGNIKDYFTSDCEQDLHKLLINDWPYALPENVQHFVCWSRLPLIHRELFSNDEGYNKALSKGLYGFTGIDNLVTENSIDGGHEISDWIKNSFQKESNVTQTAWFVNPPHLQSVKEVQHFHIFVKNQ